MGREVSLTERSPPGGSQQRVPYVLRPDTHNSQLSNPGHKGKSLLQALNVPGETPPKRSRAYGSGFKGSWVVAKGSGLWVQSLG